MIDTNELPKTPPSLSVESPSTPFAATSIWQNLMTSPEERPALIHPSTEASTRPLLAVAANMWKDLLQPITQTSIGAKPISASAPASLWDELMVPRDATKTPLKPASTALPTGPFAAASLWDDFMIPKDKTKETKDKPTIAPSSWGDPMIRHQEIHSRLRTDLWDELMQPSNGTKEPTKIKFSTESPTKPFASAATSLWDDLMIPHGEDKLTTTGSTLPHYKVIHKEKEVDIVMDLPDMSADEIDVTVDNENGTISITGHHEVKKDNSFFSSDFSQSISLEPSLDTSHMKAHLDDGVLTIAFPQEAMQEGSRKQHGVDIKYKGLSP